MCAKYYYLKKGDIVQSGDEVDMCRDNWRDKPKWVKAKRIGVKVSDPSFIAHAIYRRKIK